jgi:glycosyltransferase involved in cell wall biosynthesis
MIVTSLVIPIRNGERHLAALLDSLAAQSPSLPWEVVAVDNGSTDASMRILERYRDQLPLTVLTAAERPNPSYARNAGVLKAQGRYVLFVDADDALAPGYVEHMTAALADHALVSSIVDSTSLNPDWLRLAHGEPWQAESVGTFFDFLPATGINIGMARDQYLALGGFPEAFSSSEDIAFSWTAYMAGLRIHLVREAIYRYRYRESLSGLFRQASNWGRDNVRLYATFRSKGMPGRPLRATLQDWVATGRALVGSTDRASRARAVVQAGYCVGRMKGSLLYRTRYL